ncbi:hypothetical protein EW145_g4864 [Phellinidium pouzarii]|uniref:Uncharacterized protein n=1 Tax=Phellinidium pouzarii TaxID=167371 RepID=A0A4S4L6U6_9AGAM|nr:hypothetical protein EW145_g4864 [Phellinidium pouzarii]
MFITLYLSIRTRAFWNKHKNKDNPDLNSTLHPARTSVTVVGRAWDHIIGRMATIRCKHWPGAQEESFVNLSKATAATSLLETVSSLSDASLVCVQVRPIRQFSLRPAMAYSLPPLAASRSISRPPSLTQIQECSEDCSQELVLDSTVKLAEPDSGDEDGAGTAGGERFIGLGYPSSCFGRQPRKVGRM